MICERFYWKSVGLLVVGLFVLTTLRRITLNLNIN